MHIEDPLLASKAFGEFADPGLVVAYQSHQDAMRYLAEELALANAIAIVKGPAGSGKTTIARQQLEWSKRSGPAVLLQGRNLSPRDLVHGMLAQCDVTTTSEDDQQLLQQLSNFLMREARSAASPVLIVDDAHRAPAGTLRLLNWLAAQEARGSYAMKIVLTGTENLSAVLAGEGMSHLSRRDAVAFFLNPMSERETAIYLRTRLQAAGASDRDAVFSVDLCSQLRRDSKGWPGALNKLAFDAVRLAGGSAQQMSSPRVVVSRDGETLEEHALTERQYIIGRSELADIVILDGYASKMHAMLRVLPDAVMLVDLNSTNGITVNSRQVVRAVLRDNDIISLGHYRLKITGLPAISEQVDEHLKSTDTMAMESLEDVRRSRAQRKIRALNRNQASS